MKDRFVKKVKHHIVCAGMKSAWCCRKEEECFSFQTLEISGKIQCTQGSTAVDQKDAQRVQILGILGYYLLQDGLTDRDFGNRERLS